MLTFVRYFGVIQVKLFLLLITQSFGGDLYEGSNCRTKDGKDGVCTKLPECTSVYNALQLGKASFSSLTRCSFIGMIEVICCEDRTPAPVSRVSTSTQIPGQIIFERKPEILASTTSNPRQNLKWNYTDLSLSTFQQQPVTTNTIESHIGVPPTPSPQISWPTRQQNLQNDRRVWDYFPQFLAAHKTEPTESTRLHGNKFIGNSDQINFVTSNSNRLHNFAENLSISSTTVLDQWNSHVSKNKIESTKQISTPNSDQKQHNSAPQKHSFNSNPFLAGLFTTPSAITNTYSSILDPWMIDALETVNANQGNFPTHESIVLQGYDSNSDNHNEINPSKNLRLETTDEPAPSIRPTPESRSGRKAVTACEQYSQEVSTTLSYHILEGLPTALGEFPHMVALGYASLSAGEQLTWDCGGSLISEKFVLTAAHCANREDRRPSVIRLGTISLNSTVENSTPIDAKINEIILHPAYTPSRQYNDIALIRLEKSMVITDTIRPACLYTDVQDIDPKERLIATGWGAISLKTRAKSSVLLQTNLTAVDLSSCNQTHINYGSNRKYPNGLDQGQLCAFDPGLKADACEGDSGGPLQIKNGPNTYVIVGITSFGIGCGTEIPGVYARVAYYLDWIESIVW